MWRLLFIIAVVLLVLVGGWFLWLLNAAGELRTLTPHFDGTCTPVAGVIGAEDITIHPRTGVAYLSAYDRRVPEGTPARGAIYTYDLNASSAQVINVTPDADPDFRPHGISLYVGPDGASMLFVINHAGGQHAIEIYDVGADHLTHRRTLSDPLLVHPNDLLAVTPTEVYVTNDHHYPSGIMHTFEDYLRLPLADVVMWDGTAFRQVAGGIRLANGINLSPDRTTVYVASSTGNSVRVYDRGAGGALTFRREIPIGSGPDNIEIDADGTLWIGAHPKLLTVVRYMSGSVPRAPSQVLHVVALPTGGYRVEEVYLNLGEQLSAASVAAVRGKRLLIGAIADPRFLDCQMR